MRQVRLILMVVGMTCLIWIAADQQVARSTRELLPLVIKPATPNSLAIRLVDPDLQYITVGFRGPNRAITSLNAVVDSMTVQLEVPERGSSGQYTLVLLDELRAQMGQFPSGLAIVDVIPETVDIEVDRLVERRVRLVLGPSDHEFETPPQLDPAEVRIRVTERQYEALKESERVIVIPVDPVLKNEQEGLPFEKRVTIPKELAGGVAVLKVDPAQARLSGKLSQRVLTGRIPTVPVWLLMTKDMADEYEVVFGGQDTQLVTRAVTIRGPTELVDDLIQNPAKYDVKVMVEITREDLNRDTTKEGFISKIPQFRRWPTGVTVAEEPEPVLIKLVPRTS